MSDPHGTPEALAQMPLGQLRERAQVSMRTSNDLGGVLFGDWVSPFFTREFLRFGISPTVGTIGMFVAGLCGAVLLPFGGGWSVLAALCFVLFYVLDCVDGEVARLRGIEQYYWSLPDFFIGAAVMALFYISLGVHAYLMTGLAWTMLAGTALALALLMKKFIDVCHVFLTVAHVVGATAERRRRYLTELGMVGGGGLGLADAARGDDVNVAAPPPTRHDVIASYGTSTPALLRAAAMNFHLAMIAFLVVALLDLAVGPWRIMGVPIDLKTAFLFTYLPLYVAHVGDHLHDLLRGGFLRRSAETLRMLMRKCTDI